MADFGVIVMLFVTLVLDDGDRVVTHREQTTLARCMGRAWEMLATEAQGQGSLREGGTLEISCQMTRPKVVSP